MPKTETEIRTEIQSMIEATQAQKRLFKDSKDPDDIVRFYNLTAKEVDLGFALEEMNLEHAKAIFDF